MFDPVHAYLASTHSPSGNSVDALSLNEEEYAQRHGRLIGPPSAPGKLNLRLGKLLIRIGEKLAGEDSAIELSREIS
jgi:hypothetical protein